MSRNRPTTINGRLQEIITQLEPVAGQNRLKCPEPPPTPVTYPVSPEANDSCHRHD